MAMTDSVKFLEDLDAGVFCSKVGAAISEAVRGALGHGKSGKVSIVLEFDQVGGGRSVLCKHKLVYTAPTARGKISEEDETSTQMYCNADGSVTIFPDTQGSLFPNEIEEEV